MPLSALSKLGIAKETTWGSGSTTFINIPIEPFSYSPINFDLIRDQSLRGEFGTDFGVYQGVFHVEMDLDGHVYPNEIGYLVLSMFGSDSVTGTSAPYTHTFTLAQTAPSLALLDYNGVQTYQMRGMRAGKLSFTFNAAEDFLKWSATLNGKDYTTSTATVPTATASNAFVGWQASVSVGGSAFAKVITFEANLTRDLSIVYTANNTQAPYTIYQGPLDATGNMVIVFDSASDLNRYLSNSTASMSVTFSNGSYSFTLTSANVTFAADAAEIARDEVDLRLTLNWRGLSNATDGGPCRIILVNSTSTY